MADNHQDNSKIPKPYAIIKAGMPHCASCGGSWTMTDFQAYISCTNPSCRTYKKRFKHPVVELVEIV